MLQMVRIAGAVWKFQRPEYARKDTCESICTSYYRFVCVTNVLFRAAVPDGKKYRYPVRDQCSFNSLYYYFPNTLCVYKIQSRHNFKFCFKTMIDIFSQEPIKLPIPYLNEYFPSAVARWCTLSRHA